MPGLRIGEPRLPGGYPRSPLRLPAGTALELLTQEREGP